MTVHLTCDAPDCGQTAAAVVRLSRIAAPPPWWMMVNADGRIVVACCDDHLKLIKWGGEGAAG